MLLLFRLTPSLVVISSYSQQAKRGVCSASRTCSTLATRGKVVEIALVADTERLSRLKIKILP